MNKMPSVKILICYHKPAAILRDDILTPIHVGRALAKQRCPEGSAELDFLMNSMVGDDTGDNISLKNCSYNELTALYWAWKNYDRLGNPDFIGLMHYRRHFVFRRGEMKVYEFDGISDSYFNDIGYSPKAIYDILKRNDFFCHIGKVDGVYNHFCENHPEQDIKKVLDILDRIYPDYSKCAREYLAQDFSCFCNMFVLPKELFFSYCEFVFGILAEFEKLIDITEKRMFVSERLTGIFIYNLIKQGRKYINLPISFINEPTTLFYAYTVDNQEYETLVSISSVIRRAREFVHLEFYLMKEGIWDAADKQKFVDAIGDCPKCSLHFIDMRFPKKYHIFELAEKTICGKIAVLPPCSVMQGDSADFFRLCSTDDYDLCIAGGSEIFDAQLFVLNCSAMRKHKLAESCVEGGLAIGQGGRVGRIPHSLAISASDGFDEVFPISPGCEKSFCDIQRSSNSQIVFWSAVKPWLNILHPLSIIWWESAGNIKQSFPFPNAPVEKASELMLLQLKELDYIQDISRNITSDKLSDFCSDAIKGDTAKYCNEFSSVKTGRSISSKEVTLAEKAFIYLKKFGLKQTIKKIFQKIKGE